MKHRSPSSARRTPTVPTQRQPSHRDGPSDAVRGLAWLFLTIAAGAMEDCQPRGPDGRFGTKPKNKRR